MYWEGHVVVTDDGMSFREHVVEMENLLVELLPMLQERKQTSWTNAN